MIKILFISLVSLLLSTNVKAQGCSDAGFCSLQYKPNFDEDVDKKASAPLKNTLQVEFTYGVGEVGIKSITPAISYTRQLNSKLAWTNKINGSYFSGALGKIGNIGDLISTLSISGKSGKSVSNNWLFGVKLPFTNSNDKNGSTALPLSYQSSLGTVDVIAGANVNYKKWEFTSALQIPTTGNNQNTYFRVNAQDTFSSTNKFNRKSDALVRVAYTWTSKNQKLQVKPNILAIYHLGEDQYTNALAQKISLAGSDGLTLNANIQGFYQLSTRNAINLSLASPLQVRDIRPDGLTRSFTATIAFITKF